MDLDVPEGQVSEFLGQNGSGETTTVRMLTTLLRPTAGSAFVAGVDVFANPVEAAQADWRGASRNWARPLH
jgi:ABC-2 type transport system ATP-binding protein